jgi:2-C-methyl-D-erythritol 2,4-cyclodiphosphate synthase
MFRVGLGQDSHEFVGLKENIPLVLGGIQISEKGGLKGSSDGDVILHSICNALSSAIGGDSLSTWADEICLKQGIKDSVRYVGYIVNKLIKLKYSVGNISISVEAQNPRLKMDIIDKIKIKIACLLKIDKNQVGLTFTSGKNLTAFGLGKGIQTIAIVSILKHD